MVGENLIWIRRDKLGNQLTVGILDDVLNMVEMTVTQYPEGYQWLGFPSGVDIPTKSSIEMLDNVYHGPPAKISDELENKVSEMAEQTYLFAHIADTDIFSLTYSNWNKESLKKRLSTNDIAIKEMKVISPEDIENISEHDWGSTRFNKHARVWFTVSEDYLNNKTTKEIKNKIKEKADNSLLTDPVIYPKDGPVEVPNIGHVPEYDGPGKGADTPKPDIPLWLKLGGAGFIVMYAANTLDTFRSDN